MQYTSNFNFNLPEGTDLWNYLTQTNPNFTALDTLLKSIQDGTVTTATEVTSGTAHAVTRTLPDANVIRFTATGVWTLGDTMTIDGTPVTVVKPNGTSLQTGDYIIGSEVLGILRATQFTVYVGGGSSTMDAEDVDYDNTVSGLTATDVQAAIDEEAAAISTINSNLSNLSKNNLDSAVNVTSYTNTNYICPSDGYIRAESEYPSGYIGVEVYGSTSAQDANHAVKLASRNGLCTSTLIKKGMQIHVTGVTGTYSEALFIPIIS